MSEVHRYQVVTMLSMAGATIGYDPHGPDVVMASDFDNATRLFLDAAERAVASERREKELQQRLTAADERVDVLTKALTDVREALGREYWDQYAGLDETRDILDAALKPAEGGGDDLDEHDRSSQAYWDDQAAQGKPYEQQLREACERNGIDLMLDTD